MPIVAPDVPVVDTVTRHPSTIEEYDVIFWRVERTEYEEKVRIHAEGDIDEHVENLDWDATHHKKHDPDGSPENWWVLDLEGVPFAIQQLQLSYDVAVGAVVAKALTEGQTQLSFATQ